MSVSQELPSREVHRLAGLVAAPLPTVGLVASGAPVWLTTIVILASFLTVLRPVQFVATYVFLRLTGADSVDARSSAFRAAYYPGSPDPTLKATETPSLDAGPPPTT